MKTTIAASVHPDDMTRRQLAGFVLILGALTAFSSMSIDMYLPAFPQMARDLGIPLGMVQLSISAFLYGSAAGQLFYGPLADRWGRRMPLSGDCRCMSPRRSGAPASRRVRDSCSGAW